MRVVVVSAWEPWRVDDGAALVLDHQLRILAARHDITVLAAGAPAAVGTPPVDVTRSLPGVTLRWFGSPRHRATDQIARRVWSVRHREPAHVGFVERPGLRQAFAAAVADGVDVVHLHGWGTAAMWRLCPGTRTVHVAVDPWSVNAANRRRSAVRELIEREQRAAIAAHERRHYPRLGAVVVVTPRDAEIVRAIAPRATVVVVPNGVDPGLPPRPVGNGKIVGFHGVFDSQANVDAARNLVREVMPRVRRTVPDARVLLIGRRPPREISDLAMEWVEVAPDVPDLRRALERMTVHVDWMTSGTGIKNKVLEAMAAGRPVVASPLGAEGIGEGPGLLVADDLPGAATIVAGLLSDPARAAAVGAAGRDRVVADFGWEANAEAIEVLWSTGTLRGQP